MTDLQASSSHANPVWRVYVKQFIALVNYPSGLVVTLTNGGAPPPERPCMPWVKMYPGQCPAIATRQRRRSESVKLRRRKVAHASINRGTITRVEKNKGLCKSTPIRSTKLRLLSPP